MFEVATWITNNPIVIPFIIAGLAFIVFHIYMAIFAAIEAVVVAVYAKVKSLITLRLLN